VNKNPKVINNLKEDEEVRTESVMARVRNGGFEFSEDLIERTLILFDKRIQ